MVDIHSHILPGLDDGPEDFEVSLEMLRMARQANTTDIVATPHASPSYRYEPKLISDLIAKLQSAVEDGIKVHRGCDFHLSPQNIQAALRDPSRFAINGLCYLLVEFPNMSIAPHMTEAMQRLQMAGFTLIITHPERYAWLYQKPDILSGWLRDGCLVQVTAGARATV